ncbi:MAG TPA: hypothetical protein VHF89_21455 [Solirubrobacteraceae bacterium]|nr:hypothetical protein [Solirubrobacteraceae bacterium]
MTARRIVVVAAALVALAAAPAAADVADDCKPLGPRVQSTACHGADVLRRDAEALCRRNVTEACQPSTSRAAVEAHEASWTHDALAFQHALGDRVPLRNAPWVGTHNSFNSIGEMGPTVSDMDSNQQLTLIEQLRVDVRSLELDLHWFPSASEGGMAPIVCHGESGAGCSREKTLREVLGPIAAWLEDHDDQVLLLYLENQLGGAEGSDAAADAIEDTIGRFVYRPAPGSCEELPYAATRRDVLDAGKQVVIVSNCGAGAAWRSLSFGWADHEETRPRGFDGCHADYDRETFDRTLIRYYEDDTWLTSAASNTPAASRDDGIDADTARLMTTCGVDLLGFDQLTADDARLDALVWSWAEGENVAAECAVLRPEDGRWEARRCRTKRPFACRSGSGFALTARAYRGDKAPRGCDPPRTGRENELAEAAAAGDAVWLALP